MTKQEQRKHYDRVARIGCILCKHLGYETQDVGCQIHHIRRTSKRSNAPVIGLCYEHHIGNTGIHGLGRRGFERKYSPITEEKLLEMVQSILKE